MASPIGWKKSHSMNLSSGHVMDGQRIEFANRYCTNKFHFHSYTYNFSGCEHMPIQLYTHQSKTHCNYLSARASVGPLKSDPWWIALQRVFARARRGVMLPPHQMFKALKASTSLNTTGGFNSCCDCKALQPMHVYIPVHCICSFSEHGLTYPFSFQWHKYVRAS